MLCLIPQPTKSKNISGEKARQTWIRLPQANTKESLCGTKQWAYSVSHHPILLAITVMRLNSHQAQRHPMIQPRRGSWNHPNTRAMSLSTGRFMQIVLNPFCVFAEALLRSLDNGFSVSKCITAELLGLPLSGIILLTNHWNGRGSFSETSWLLTLFPKARLIIPLISAEHL